MVQRMIRQNNDYGYDIQKLYLEMMLSDPETFVRCQSIFDPTLFDTKLVKSATFIDSYVRDHTILPTYEMVQASCNINLLHPGELQEGHYDWLLSEFETFIRHKGLERAILKSADLLEEGNYGPVEEMIKAAVQVGLTKDLGTDYFADPRTRLAKIKSANGQMSTGWPTLDRVLYGGFSRGELEIFSGGSGSGKSLFLANLGLNWTLLGLHVVYVTLELSEELVSMRIDAMSTGIPARDLFKRIDDVELKVKVLGKNAGTYQVKYMPSGKNTNDIRSYLKEYEVKLGRKVDVLIVDYLDLLMPISKKISAENLYMKDKFVSEELRNLAMEKQCITVSAAQLNRSAVEEVEFDHSHISGGLSKIQTADNVFGIFTSRAMREQGKYQLQFMKTRNSSGVGQKIDLDFNIDTLRITDSGDGSASPTDSAQPSNSMMASLRRTSTVDPAQGVAVKKSAVQVESTKLRQLLNNIE